jgi:Holliday junction DNA helicase RuvA
MITKLTGTLNRVKDDAARIQVGPLEYEVLVTEAVRRQIQLQTGRELTLFISEYLEGTPTGNRFVPRRLGFLTEVEQDFFDLLCTVDKIGPKKGLRALARPVREIADAINRQDGRWLATLPGIGAATAEQMVTTLKRKIAPFLMAAQPAGQPALAAADPPPVDVDEKPKVRRKPPAEVPPAPDLPPPELLEDVYQALISLGHNAQEASAKVQQLSGSGRPFRTLDEALTLVYAGGTKR